MFSQSLATGSRAAAAPGYTLHMLESRLRRIAHCVRSARLHRSLRAPTIALCAALAIPAVAQDDGATFARGRQIRGGEIQGVFRPDFVWPGDTHVVRTDAEYRALAALLGFDPADRRDVDFRRSTVVAIVHSYSSGCHGVNVRGIRIRGRRAEVVWRRVLPGDGCACTANAGVRFVLVEVRRVRGPVTFTERRPLVASCE